MKFQSKSIIVAMIMAGLWVPNAIAQQTVEDNKNSSHDKSTQTKYLLYQIYALKSQLHALRKEVRQNHPVKDSNTVLADNTTQGNSQSSANTSTTSSNNSSAKNAASSSTTSLTNSTSSTTSNASGKSTSNAPTREQTFQKIVDETDYLPFDLDVPGQAFVSTGPYVGVPVQYAGSELIVNSPSVNTDLQLLGIRKHVLDQLTLMAGGQAYKEPYHSHLLLSGIVEGQAYYYNHSGQANGNVPSTNVDVTNMTIDFTMFGPSDWLTAFIELTYNNGTPASDLFDSRSQFTDLNSRVYVNKAFVTIGDFDRSPVYATFGQLYVPFGVYSSVMVTDPLSKDLGRTKARAIQLAFQQQRTNGFYGAIFGFRGDAHSAVVDSINNGGLNLGFKFTSGPITGDFGGSVISNLADSVYMQLGDGFQFYEQMVHRVPAYNVRANFGFGSHIDVIAEYIIASTDFNPYDMSFNGHGAKPSAWDAEIAYSFYMFNKPSAVAIGYTKSNQALALGIPLYRWSLLLNTSFWRNTLQSLELRRDREYAKSDFATGAGGVILPRETGQNDYVATFQFDYYF